MRLNKTGLTIALIISVVIAIIVFIAVMHKQRHLHKDDAPIQTTSNITLLNPSEVFQVSKESIINAIEFTGDISAKEQTIISSEIDAKVLDVLVLEGQSVKQGSVLALLDTGDLVQAVSQQQAQLDAAQSQLHLNQRKMEKQAELLKQGFVSQIAYDELVNNYQSAMQNYNAQLALLKRTQKQLSNTKIVAPFSGVIYQKNIDTGQFASKNTRLFALANLNSLQIQSPISSDRIDLIKLKQTALFTVENGTSQHTGVVARINPVSEVGTRSYMVYIDVINKDNELKPGQFVRGKIILQKLDNQLVVNCDALFNDHENSYVMAIENDTIRKIPVRLILTDTSNNRCAIDGVKQNSHLVSKSVLSIKSGDKVKVLESV